MKINEILSEDLSRVEFEPQTVKKMKHDGQDMDTNMDDPATATLVRNKKTKELDVIQPGEQANKAEYDQVDDTDQMGVERELKKQQKERERAAKKAQLQAKMLQNNGM